MAKISITILGIHDGHDAGATIVRNGKILAALQKERPRNVKQRALRSLSGPSFMKSFLTILGAS